MAMPGVIQRPTLVALRKESVDRNHQRNQQHHHADVALRKESVDRNLPMSWHSSASYRSLSARRAWIEISRPSRTLSWTTVALRKESVDRNTLGFLLQGRPSVALRKESVDRNTRLARRRKPTSVALRKESVDRNDRVGGLKRCNNGRSPQGERG